MGNIPQNQDQPLIDPNLQPSEADFDNLIKDVPGITEDNTSKQDTQNDLIKTLQDEVKSLKDTIQDKQPPGHYSNVRSERDQLVDRYAKAINFAVSKGAKYDPATGQLYESEPEKLSADDQLKELDNKLKLERKELKQKLVEGDITQDQYIEQLDDITNTFRDQKLDIKFQEQQQKIQPQQTQSIDPLESKFQAIRQKYPESDNPNSDLYKAMTDIIQEDDTIDIDAVNYGEADPITGKITKYTGNPEARKFLIERAMLRLEKQGVSRTNQSNSSTNALTGHQTTDYQARQKEPIGLDKQSLSALVSEGFSSKTLIRDVNSSISRYNETGILELEG